MGGTKTGVVAVEEREDLQVTSGWGPDAPVTRGGNLDILARRGL